MKKYIAPAIEAIEAETEQLLDASVTLDIDQATIIDPSEADVRAFYVD